MLKLVYEFIRTKMHVLKKIACACSKLWLERSSLLEESYS